MRVLPICIVLLLLALSCYAYFNNPEGCVKLGGDLVAVLTPRSSQPTPALGDSVPSVAPSPSPESVTTTTTSAPAPAPVASQPTTPLTPVKAWAPPDVIPSQPNWTWTTADGTTYQNVTIDKIEVGTVTIMHSKGVAHIDTSTLPPEIQRQLNYDPAMATAAIVEKKREAEHPYYPVSEAADAETVAAQMQWPVAWVYVNANDMTAQNPEVGTHEELTQLILEYLKSKAIIIYLVDGSQLAALPPIIHAQFFIMDDGPIPGGHHFWAPKTVFSNADATKILGRVAYTQLKAQREIAFDAFFQSIENGAGTTPAPASPSPTESTTK